MDINTTSKATKEEGKSYISNSAIIRRGARALFPFSVMKKARANPERGSHCHDGIVGPVDPA